MRSKISLGKELPEKDWLKRMNKILKKIPFWKNPKKRTSLSLVSKLFH
jgi:hypothetical protein